MEQSKPRAYSIIESVFGFIVHPDSDLFGRSNGLLAVNKQQ